MKSQHYMVSDTAEIPSKIVLEMVNTMNKIFETGDGLSSLVVEKTNRISEKNNHVDIKPSVIYNF